MEEDHAAAHEKAAAGGEREDTDMAEQAGPSGQGEAKDKVWYSDQNTVFVKGLPPKVTEADLQELFKACGTIRNIRLPRDPQGRTRVSRGHVVCVCVCDGGGTSTHVRRWSREGEGACE